MRKKFRFEHYADFFNAELIDLGNEMFQEQLPWNLKETNSQINGVLYPEKIYKVEVKIDLIKNNIVRFNCNCSLFTEQKGCAHIVCIIAQKLNDWKGLSKVNSFQPINLEKILEISSITDIQQFIRFYAHVNPNFGRTLKQYFGYAFQNITEFEKYLKETIQSQLSTKGQIPLKKKAFVLHIFQHHMIRLEQKVQNENWKDAFVLSTALINQLELLKQNFPTDKKISNVNSTLKNIIGFISINQISPELEGKIKKYLLLYWSRKNLQFDSKFLLSSWIHLNPSKIENEALIALLDKKYNFENDDYLFTLYEIQKRNDSFSSNSFFIEKLGDNESIVQFIKSCVKYSLFDSNVDNYLAFYLRKNNKHHFLNDDYLLIHQYLLMHSSQDFIVIELYRSALCNNVKEEIILEMLNIVPSTMKKIFWKETHSQLKADFQMLKYEYCSLFVLLQLKSEKNIINFLQKSDSMKLTINFFKEIDTLLGEAFFNVFELKFRNYLDSNLGLTAKNMIFNLSEKIASYNDEYYVKIQNILKKDYAMRPYLFETMIRVI